jgi:hypothetical protein
VWPWKSRAPYRDIVTSQRGHWPLLRRVSGITWRGSKLLETLTLVRVTYGHVWAQVAGWVGEEEKHTYCCYAYRLYFLTCDMYKSSLRHIHDPVLSSLKMKGILSFYPFKALCNQPLLPITNGFSNVRSVIKNYGECCCRVRSNGKAGNFNTRRGASKLSNNVR